MTNKDAAPDQRANDREREILRSAAALFAEKGYQRTAVREIADRAGIAPGTIYLYFDGKGDLLIQLMTRLTELEELDAELVRAFHTDARTFLTTISRERMSRLVENEEMVRAIMPQMLVRPALRERFYRQLVEPLIALLEQYVRERIELGDIRPVDVPLTVRVVQSLFIGLLVVRILGDEQLQTRWNELPDVIGTVLFEGLDAGGHDHDEQGRDDSAGHPSETAEGSSAKPSQNARPDKCGGEA